MLLVTVLYEWLSSYLLPDFIFNAYEFVGTWAGLTTVWLARTENVLCWPWGIISALTLGYFFATIGLPGQQWLNWGYFWLFSFGLGNTGFLVVQIGLNFR
ncbi:MAG: nicotinamide mononucleotide transporter [Candidatus Paceibacterota bacterium]